MQLAGEQPAAVLVVDDEPLVRLVTAEFLQDAGFHVIEAHDAEGALLLLEARPETRAIVTDVQMPGPLDGFALARLAALRLPGVGIVLTSGNVMPRKGELPDGAVYLRKPWSPSDLVGQIRQLIDTGRETPDAP